MLCASPALAAYGQQPEIQESRINESMLKFALFALISSSNLTGIQFSPDQKTITFVLNNEGGGPGTIPFTGTVTMTNTVGSWASPGYTFDNETQTMHTPDGRSIKLVIVDDAAQQTPTRERLFP